MQAEKFCSIEVLYVHYSDKLNCNKLTVRKTSNIYKEILNSSENSLKERNDSFRWVD